MSFDDARHAVDITIAGYKLERVTEYSVTKGVLTQPAAFSFRIGSSLQFQPVSTLLAAVPPGTEFQLDIAGIPQFFGRIDGYTVRGSGSGGTVIEIRGRDDMAQLVDSYVTSERSYENLSFRELTQAVLDEVVGPGKSTLFFSNDANRDATAGAKSKGKGKASATIDDDGNTRKTFQAKLGMSWLSGLLKPQLDRGGLFLHALGTERNAFVLASPNVTQTPFYQIIHDRSKPYAQVKSFTYKNEPTARYSRCEVWGRRGGGDEARSAVLGFYEDPEMVALGFTKVLTIKDAKCTTVAQAEYLARRKIAEARRATWNLTYTVGGHTTVGLDGSKEPVVWIPDTMVQVNDAELGLQGVFYLENVSHQGTPEKTTTLTLMRPEDVVFGESDITAGSGAVATKGAGGGGGGGESSIGKVLNFIRDLGR